MYLCRNRAMHYDPTNVSGLFYVTDIKNNSCNNVNNNSRNLESKEDRGYFDLDKEKGEQNFAGTVFPNKNEANGFGKQENVIERYQVMIPSFTMLQDKKIKHAPLNYAVSQSPQTVILTTDKMDGSTTESSVPGAANLRRLHFRCQFCGDRLATRNSLCTHIKSHRLPYCRFCLVVLKTDEQLRMHLNRVHPPKSPHRHVTVVTSKYGRRRQVLSTLSLIKRRNKNDKELKSYGDEC